MNGEHDKRVDSLLEDCATVYGAPEAHPTTERQASHTPGPWSNERIWDTPASRIHARVEGVPMALAEVFTMRNAGEKEANARLIAAAPDMFAALNEVHGCFDVQTMDEILRKDGDVHGDDEFCVNVTAKQLRAINDAILKAEGKKP